MSVQRPGYPNLSIKLYEDYDAWQEHRFVELATTVTTLTMRDGLYGRNEGILQFHDAKNLHTKMNGEQIIQISVANANSQNVQNRIYGSKHFSVSVDEKGDNIIAIQLEPLHILENLKFSRAFFTNATESIQEMIRVIYKDRPLIAPTVEGLNTFVPRVPWVNSLESYMQYVREVGMSVDAEQFVFVWEDIRGIHILDYPSLIAQTPQVAIVGEPRLIGDLIVEMDKPLVYDFIWHAKTNQHTRNPIEDTTFYTYSYNDKKIERIVTGDGSNSVYIARSGAYSDMTYRNGYEEAIRICQMAQYDGYASCKQNGNFEVYPGMSFKFGDPKEQFDTTFYVDEVVHEISNNSSITTMYMFTNGKALTPVELVKVKTQALEPDIIAPVDDGVPAGNTKDWDLNILCSAVTAGALGRSSSGQCALYVRRALEKAQKRKLFSGGLGHANQFPPRLVAMGWTNKGMIQEWKKGDIAVFPKTDTVDGRKYGHVCVWTGLKWVSDFIQNRINPTKNQSLPYSIYRVEQ